MNSQLTIVMVRHAEPVDFEGKHGVVHRSGPESEWNDRPLSVRGLRDATEMAETLCAEKPIAIYSSPYRRARQTIEPLATLAGLSIVTIDDLRERLLSPNLSDDYREHARRAWEDFDYALEGGESSREAQRRVMQVLDELRNRHPKGIVVLASHGNLIALALNAITRHVGHDFQAAMPVPAVYRLRFADGAWQAEGPGLD